MGFGSIARRLSNEHDLVSVSCTFHLTTFVSFLWCFSIFYSLSFLFGSLTRQWGIAARLEHPSHAMQEAYGWVIIHAVRYAAQFLAATLTACLVPCVVVWLSRMLCVIHVVELDD